MNRGIFVVFCEETPHLVLGVSVIVGAEPKAYLQPS